MNSKTFYCSIAFLGCLFAVDVIAKDAIDNSVVNKNVDRKIDLSSSLAKITNDITVENTGKGTVAYYVFAMTANSASSLAFLGASIKDSDSPLVVSPATVHTNEKDAKFFKIELFNPLAAGKSIVISVRTIFSHVLEPFPAEIKQAEKQLVRYVGDLHFYTPYQTVTQKTVVSLASSQVESYTKIKPVSKSENTISYGPYEKVGSFSREPLDVHFENNKPFLAVTKMTRVIEISHWGNIAVEETYDIRHTGAKLKGPFSRYDYQRQPDPLSSVKSFKTVLPASAADVYYRDEIGNISTSSMRVNDDAVELEIRPRFPLFGGWKTHYIVGYNVPSYQYLYTDGGSQYLLKMPFIDHIFDNQVVDEVTVKIILPESAQVSEVDLPFPASRGSDELEYTYLDTIGRPVIVLTKTNTVEEHIIDFQLKYTFNKLMLLREPMLVVGAFYLLFLFVIVYVRLDFSIARDDVAESRLKVASYVEEAQNILDKRSALYQSYKDATDKYKASKDMSAYQNQKKQIDNDHKRLTQQLTELQAKLKQEGADPASERISDIQKLDGQLRESLSGSASLAEKLVANKLSKDHYLTQEEQASNKRRDLLEKMESYSSAM